MRTHKIGIFVEVILFLLTFFLVKQLKISIYTYVYMNVFINTKNKPINPIVFDIMNFMIVVRE